MTAKILITSTSFGKQDKSPLKLLENQGYEIIWNESGKPLAPESLITMLDGCDGVIAGLDFFTAQVFEQCPQLKVVARYGVGVDRVDLAAAEKAGVIVTNTPTANSDSVADLALSLMLAAARHIPDAHQGVVSGGWPKVFGVSLSNKTVGLLGFGRIGARVAKRVQGFGCRVLVYDPFITAEIAAAQGCEKLDLLDDVLKAADFVSLHLPANEETTGIMDAAKFALMKPTAIIVNTARGEVVNEDDLLAALKSGKLGGAGLDAYAPEPPDASKFQGVPNLVLTPHSGAHTTEALYNMAMESARDLIAVLSGNSPAFRVV